MFLRKRRKIVAMDGLFTGHFVDVKAFYALEFDSLPSISFIGDLDTSKVYNHIIESLQKEIIAIYQHTYFDHTAQELYFNNSIVVLGGKRMIELGNNSCTVLHTCHQHAWSVGFVKSLSLFRISTSGNTIGFTMQATMN